MIVTIKAPTARSMAVGAFESIKLGLNYQMMPDNYLDIVVADMRKAEHVSASMNGEIVAVIDKLIMEDV
jgi:hypothetical protein